MSADLITRLRAALDERETTARAAIDMDASWRVADSESKVCPVTDHSSWGYYIADAYYRSYAHHIAAHDPAFVLADITAKRAILDLHVLAEQNDGDGFTTMRCMVCDPDGSEPFYPCATLRLLAEAYGIRP